SLEDRVQIEGVNAEVFEVIELLLDALEVTAVEAGIHVPLVKRLAGPGFEIRGSEPVATPRARRRGIVAGVTVAKALGEDLVPDGVASPLRRVKDVRFGQLGFVSLRIAHARASILEDERVFER